MFGGNDIMRMLLDNVYCIECKLRSQQRGEVVQWRSLHAERELELGFQWPGSCFPSHWQEWYKMSRSSFRWYQSVPFLWMINNWRGDLLVTYGHFFLKWNARTVNDDYVPRTEHSSESVKSVKVLVQCISSALSHCLGQELKVSSKPKW